MSDWKNVQYKDGKMRTSEGGGGGSSTFAGLDDVSFSNIQNGQVPKYNSETHKWENANESGGGGTVTDVQVDGVSVVNQQGVAEIETPNAGGIEYDNQQSGLQATDVQSAIDELAQGGGGGGNVDDVEVNGVSVVDAQKIAKITSYKEVTLAEYQALPSSKLSDNVLYCIKDTGGADSFPPLIYSDEEREIGVWRDGKPLYQKTVKVTTTLAVGDNDVSVSTPNLETLVDAWSTAKMGNGCWVQISTSNPYINWNLSIYDIDSTKVRFCVGSDIANRGLSEVYVTLQYTKTTDTAGSGTWTTQGGYAHHYSTTEQVVGTWIDGKPIYEKVYTGTTNDLMNIVDNSVGYIEELIDIKASTTSPNGNKYTLYYGGNNDYLRVWLDDNGTSIRLYIGSSYPPRPVSYKIILQYTKTTD